MLLLWSFSTWGHCRKPHFTLLTFNALQKRRNTCSTLQLSNYCETENCLILSKFDTELQKMSTQKGNTRKSGPPKYQNKSTFKNVYHDTSKKTQNIVNTVVAGVCVRCKDIIDWKIKYKKYKPLTQPKTW